MLLNYFDNENICCCGVPHRLLSVLLSSDDGDWLISSGDLFIAAMRRAHHAANNYKIAKALGGCGCTLLAGAWAQGVRGRKVCVVG